MWHLASNVECLAECARRVRIPASRLKIKAKRGLAMTRWIPMELQWNSGGIDWQWCGGHEHCARHLKGHTQSVPRRKSIRKIRSFPNVPWRETFITDLSLSVSMLNLSLSRCLHRLWCTTGEAFQKSFEGKRVKIWKRLAS